MKCIIGLGNIGKEYLNTRHNIGFICLDKLAEKYDIHFDKKKTKCIYGEGVIKGQKVALVKPTTFMNLSGEAVNEIMKWYKITIEDICIIYDDIDLTLGEIRYREKGSAGTHNGMKSVLEYIKTFEVSRIRVGIENRAIKEIDLSGYVLSKFTKEELNIFEENQVFDKVNENVDNFLTKII